MRVKGLRHVSLVGAAVLGMTIMGGSTSWGAGTAPTATTTTAVPRPDHVVVVVLENKPYSKIMDPHKAPFLSSLARHSANMTRMRATSHPSQPNYLALFSGSTHGVTSDKCRSPITAPNLGAQLLSTRRTYRSYAEGLPSTGYQGCRSGLYARKHAPWTNFTNVPAGTQQSFRSFPSHYAMLPDLSFVLPNMCHDMHDCNTRTGDRWLKSNLDSYVRWAMTHNSLLVVTFDEGPAGQPNQIPTLIAGQHVRPGNYPESIDHYTMLRTLEAMYGLPGIGTAAHRAPVTDIWTR